MSAMTPKIYFEECVTQNHQEFSNAPHVRRLAFNDCVSAYHMRDHMWEYFSQRNVFDALGGQTTLSTYTQFLKDHLKNAFVAVQVVATSYKHLYVSDQNIVTKKVSAGSVYNSIGNFYYDPDKPFSYISDPLDIRNYSLPLPESKTQDLTFLQLPRIFVDVAPDKQYELLEATDRVVAYWGEVGTKWG